MSPPGQLPRAAPVARPEAGGAVDAAADADADAEAEPEAVRASAVTATGLALLAIIAAAALLAWGLMGPAPDAPARAASPPFEELFATTTAAPAPPAPARYEWLDRRARTVRIPIDSAIDAAIARPSLIAGRAPP